MKLSKNRRAFALVLVLIALVISSSMAVFFLTSVARERLGVNLYATGTEVHHLAGMPASQVIGLINAATKEGIDSMTGKRANPVSWASQPGMIRTYDSSGSPSNVYKLYSWNNMVQPGAGFDPSTPAQLPPNDWRNETAHYVDINQPVNDVYPIVDPRAEGEVTGFSVNEGNPVVGGSDKENAPMPVKWLYVLEDGKMVAPDGGSGNLANIPGASSGNAVIGRVAFWTDDETCKVNINTASEGAYWDIPRSGSRDDVQFAGNPLTKNEYQRMPGHPALTSLSAIFPELVDDNATDPTQTRWANGYGTKAEKIYDMVPRLAWGKTSGAYQGSQGGIYPVPQYTYNYPPARDAIPVNSLPRPVVLDTDRLYVISDDFWFKPDRAANAALNDNLNIKDFQKRLFFLTANSRAPETTLFETPRVSLWPITWPNASSYYTLRKTKNASANLQPPTSFNDPITDSASRWITAEERLLAFCGTLNTANGTGGDRYYFQRKDPDSPVNDWDNPAFSAYSKRNRDLVAYLTRQMAKPVPGFGKSLKDSWGSEEATNWAGLNTFNYVRSQVNQYTVPNAFEGVRYSFAGVSFRFGKIGGVAVSGASYQEPNAKVTTPLRATINSKEYNTTGTYPALEEAVMVFYAAKRDEPVPPANPSAQEADPSVANYPDWRNPFLWTNLINLNAAIPYPVGAKTTIMRAVMLLDFTGLEPGVGINPTFWVKVKGNSFQVNGSSIGFPSTTGKVAQCTLNSNTTYNTIMDPLMDDTSAPKIFSNTATGSNVWQLVSNDITVQPSDTTFGFTGTEVTIEVYACNPADVKLDPTSDPTRRVYQKTMNFAKWNGANYPMPMAPRWNMSKLAYRFDANGNPLPYGSGTSVANGTLPGGTKIKTEPVSTNPMRRFHRDIDPLRPLPDRYDLWQPNPEYAAIPGATPPAATTWAWAEYAPTIGDLNQTAGVATISDPRTSNVLYYGRGGKTVFVYRASNAGYSKQALDTDDARESGENLRNVSTNFRKRVAATSQRNTANRPAFCVEGWSVVAPTDYTDPNVMWTSGSTTIRADMFMYSTEMPLREHGPLLTPYDTIMSMVNTPPNSTDDRDPRLAISSGSLSFNSDNFETIRTVMSPQNPMLVIDDSKYPRTTVRSQWHQFGTPGEVPSATGYRSLPTFNAKPFARSKGMSNSLAFDGLAGITAGPTNKISVTADWTGMPGRYADGGLLTRPDQEYQQLSQDTSGAMFVPYFNRETYGDYVGGNTGGTALTATDAELSYFSPNRQVPSPVILGALPRTMTSDWQTLAFAPNPANPAHPGLATARPNAPDHLFLDLLWMPVAEPYPVSDQLSTAGKVNLNYRMMPFPYIERKTALYAAMKNTWITAITENDNNISNFKTHGLMRDQPGSKTRYAIDIAQTLLGFDLIFDAGDLFRSASQLCEMFLVPKGQAFNTISAFWTANRLTPDNAREQPYNDLYSRVTTKSNTFTVHWRVQSLRKTPGTDPAVWDESRDRQISELRGSTLIERYIDPNTKDDPATLTVNEGMPDYATETDPEPLSRFYKWRVVSENYFQP